MTTHASSTPRAQAAARDDSHGSERARDKSARNNLAGLAVSGLSVRFDETVGVDDVTFHVEPGEVLGMLGASVCGTATLSRANTWHQYSMKGVVGWDGIAMSWGSVYE